MKRPSGPAAPPLPADPITQICDRYRNVFTTFCEKSDAEAIKSLNGDFNSALKNEWNKTPDKAMSTPPDWNEISRRLETAKAVREKKDQTPQHTGSLTQNGQQQVNPDFSKLHSLVEQEKNLFLVEAKNYGFSEAYPKIYNEAIASYTTIDPCLIDSIDDNSTANSSTQAAGQQDAADQMEGVEYTNAVGEVTATTCKAYDKENNQWNNIFAWRKCGKGHQILVQKTPDDAKVAIYQICAAKPHGAEFEEFQDSGGLDVDKNKGSFGELQGKTFKDFDWKAVAYVPRKSMEPLIGWAKWVEMQAYGSFTGQSKCKFFARTDMGKAWGEDSMLGHFLTHIDSAGLERPKPPTRNLLAGKGRRAIEGRPQTGGLLGNEKQQAQLQMGDKTHNGDIGHPQIGETLGDGKQQGQLPMDENTRPVDSGQPQIGEKLQQTLKDLSKMSLEEMTRELAMSRIVAATPVASMVSEVKERSI